MNAPTSKSIFLNKQMLDDEEDSDKPIVSSGSTPTNRKDLKSRHKKSNKFPQETTGESLTATAVESEAESYGAISVQAILHKNRRPSKHHQQQQNALSTTTTNVAITGKYTETGLHESVALEAGFMRDHSSDEYYEDQLNVEEDEQPLLEIREKVPMMGYEELSKKEEMKRPYSRTYRILMMTMCTCGCFYILVILILTIHSYVKSHSKPAY
jgi:hypothetical protein